MRLLPRPACLVLTGSLLAGLLSACREETSGLEALQARAELDHRGGRLAAATTVIAQILRSAARSTEQEWSARLLGAEIHLDGDDLQAGADLVEGELPATLKGSVLEARYHKVRGELAWRQGNGAEADRRLARAAALAPPDRRQPLSLEILGRQGLFRGSAGAVDEAVITLQQVIDLAADHPRWRAAALNSWGFFDLQNDRCANGLPRLEQALADARAAAVVPLVARIQLNLGICLTSLGDYDRARDVLEGAVATHESMAATRSLQNGLGSLANNYLLAGDRARAIVYYERALRVARSHDPAAAARWALNLAVSYGDQQSWRLAARHTEEARRLLAAAGERGANLHLTWNEARIAEGEQRFDLAERGYREVISQGANKPELLWDTQARLANLYQKLGRQEEAGAGFAQALAGVERLRSEGREIEHQLSFLERLVCLHRDHARWMLGQGKVAESLAAYEESRAQILADRTGRPRSRTQTGTGDLRSKARARGEVLISYMLDARGSHAWVVDAETVRVVKLPPEEEIERAATAYRSFIDNSLRDPRQLEDSPAHALFRLVVAPLLTGVAAGSRVTVAPDGALHGVPLGALVVPGDDGTQPTRYWIEQVTLTVAPSLLTLPDRPADAGVAPAGASLVGIGDPPDAGPAFPRLPSAADELGSLDRHFPGHRRIIARGAEARPEVYAQSELAAASLIHFAAHALADPVRPLDSSIVLAPGARGNRLSVRQVLAVTLQAQLVTISACRSAGARRYHSEGLVGFAWGFLSAGAHHVIAGLWDVPDRSTGELMDRMYAELAGGAGPAEALRAAQLALVQGGGAWATPFYWAAFQVYAGGARGASPAALASTGSRKK